MVTKPKRKRREFAIYGMALPGSPSEFKPDQISSIYDRETTSAEQWLTKHYSDGWDLESTTANEYWVIYTMSREIQDGTEQE